MRSPWKRGGTVVLGAILSAAAGAAPAAASANSLGDAPSRFVVVDGIRVHYKSLGEGRVPLVYVHGWTADMEFWREQVAGFDGRIRQIAIDLPGHGESTRPDVEYTPDLFARAIDAVMADAGAKKGVLVGHSMGAPVCLRFYRLFPKRVAAIVTVDGLLRPPQASPEELQKWISQFEGPGYKEAHAKFVDAMFPSESEAGLREWARTRAQRTPQYVAVSAMKSMFDRSYWSEEPIKVPLLVLNAPNPNWTEEYRAFIRTIAPKHEYRLIEGTGHFLMLEKPAEFNAALGAFLKANRFLKE